MEHTSVTSVCCPTEWRLLYLATSDLCVFVCVCVCRYYSGRQVAKDTSRGNAITVTKQKHLRNYSRTYFATRTSLGNGVAIIRLVPCTVLNYWCICQKRHSFVSGFNGRLWFLLPNLGETVADTSSSEIPERVKSDPTPC
jgi:hypothetical protein